jgi:hypothetical protein
MKWLLLLSALLWAGMNLFGHLDQTAGRHASVMGMLTFIGYLILDRIEGSRRA